MISVPADGEAKLRAGRPVRLTLKRWRDCGFCLLSCIRWGDGAAVAFTYFGSEGGFWGGRFSHGTFWNRITPPVILL